MRVLYCYGYFCTCGSYQKIGLSSAPKPVSGKSTQRRKWLGGRLLRRNWLTSFSLSSGRWTCFDFRRGNRNQSVSQDPLFLIPCMNIKLWFCCLEFHKQRHEPRYYSPGFSLLEWVADLRWSSSTSCRQNFRTQSETDDPATTQLKSIRLPKSWLTR